MMTTKRLFLGLVIALALSACQPPTEVATPADVRRDAARPPSIEEPTEEQMRGAALPRNSVRTQHLLNGSVTGPKLAVKAKAITVTAAGTTGSSAADPDCTTAGGAIVLGFRQTGNQDQHVDSIVLNADGSVTVTLAAAATANNTFAVMLACWRGQY
jgi:hypothetical protein